MGLVDTRRRAERLDCTIPVRVKGVGRPVTGTTVNLSRVGVLLRIDREELEIPDDATTAEVVREVNRSLGDVVVVDLHFELLGALVRKGLRVARVTLSTEDHSHVELGCDFSSPLSPEQVSFIGVPLPEILPEFEDLEDETTEDEAAAPMCVYMSAEDPGRGSAPVLVSVPKVEGDGIVARVVDMRSLPVLPHRGDPGALLEAITEAYGGEVRLLLVAGAKPLWAGRGRIQGASRPKTAEGYDLHVRLDPSGVAFLAGARGERTNGTAHVAAQQAQPGNPEGGAGDRIE